MSERDNDQTAIFAVLLGAALVAWWMGWGRSEEWSGFVYPNFGNSEKYFVVGTFDNFEDCQQSAIDALRAIPGGAERGDYECGTSCKVNEYGLNVCKETRK